ncbi:acyl-CoA dehydrogenase family protein [Sphingobium aromaticivastans]|uniref:acyl-CoA dehydrogenase family protein n=1 Tax=Sphingobium aromaticivastans TaxID=1778665 RepID=UPI003017AE65
MIDQLVSRTADFVRDVVIPFEKDPRIGAHGPAEALVRDLRAAAREAGLIAPQIPINAGGAPLSHRDFGRVLRASGYSMLGPLAMNLAAPDEGNMHLLEKVASAEQKRRFLDPLARGETRSAFLMTEPADDNGAGSDPSMLTTVAEQQGEGWRISGRKTFATGAEGAAFAIVMARTQQSATMFLMPMDTPGVMIERILDTIDSSMPGGHAAVTLDNVDLPDDAILGAIDEGFRYAQVRLAPARLTHCMRWTGAARRAHDIASAYAIRRHAFGKPLIDHEGVGFMLADNLIDLKQAELMSDWCADVLDSGANGTAESSMTKVAVSEALFRVADRCVQIMGGTGVTSDTVVEQVFREVRAFRIYDGPSEVHRWSLAKRLKNQLKDIAQ